MNTRYHLPKAPSAIIVLSALLLIPIIAPTAARAQKFRPWPADASWVPIQFNGAPVTDVLGEINPTNVDVCVSTPQPYSAYTYYDGVNLFFRLQVEVDPAPGGSFGQRGWLVETCMGNGTYLGQVAIDGGSTTNVNLRRSAGSGFGVQTVEALANPLIATSMARTIAVAGSTTFDVDWQVPFSEFAAFFGHGITPSTNIKFCYGTANGSLQHINKDFMVDALSSFDTVATFVNINVVKPTSVQVGSLPVELVSFAAHHGAGMNHLTWKTATEASNLGFEIERRTSTDTWTTLGFVQGHGTSNTPNEYSFDDNFVAADVPTSYRLKQIDRDGTFEYSGIVTVNTAGVASFTFNGVYPNPGAGASQAGFALSEPATVTLAVYNALGQEVARPIDGAALASGTHSASFNPGTLPGGLYFFRLNANGQAITKMWRYSGR